MGFGLFRYKNKSTELHEKGAQKFRETPYRKNVCTLSEELDYRVSINLHVLRHYHTVNVQISMRAFETQTIN